MFLQYCCHCFGNDQLINALKVSEIFEQKNPLHTTRASDKNSIKVRKFADLGTISISISKSKTSDNSKLQMKSVGLQETISDFLSVLGQLSSRHFIYTRAFFPEQ